MEKKPSVAARNAIYSTDRPAVAMKRESEPIRLPSALNPIWRYGGTTQEKGRSRVDNSNHSR